MAARVESQAGGADDGVPPSTPYAFENVHMLGVTEAIMWIACRRRFSHDTIREHLRRHRDRGQWRYGRSQLRRPLQERAEKAERQLIGLIIGGVPATGTLDDEGDPDHNERVPVPVEFLKDGAYIELLSGHIRADPLLEKHGLYERPTYLDIDIDRDAFFKALAAAKQRSQASTRRRGPRPKYRWAAFHAEVARRDDLPVIQADLERAMTDWCVETWGEDNCPGESTIRAQVSRYYPG